MRYGFQCLLACLLSAWTLPAPDVRAAAPAASGRTSLGPRTALDRYVAQPDPSFRFRSVTNFTSEGATTYALEMVSQTWLTTNEVDQPVWKHWLTITKPDGARPGTALLVIGGGDSRKRAPTKVNPVTTLIAKATGSVVAELSNIPSQPLTFAGTTNKLKEDDLIAYTWEQFLKTGDERWPARLPMTKAAVRAMDAVIAFMASEEAGRLQIEKFVVVGASKRGWTTWTTALVDERVVAILPLVIDALNLGASLQHHYGSYGFFAPAVGSYTNRHLMDWAGTPEFRELTRIEDPYEYRERLTLPKFVITASGDQFFPVDSARHYFKDLPGPKYLRIVPNTNHGMSGMDTWLGIVACYDGFLKGTEFPQFKWQLEPSGALKVESETAPSEVRLWKAHNDKARDFRMEAVGPIWDSTVLTAESKGLYRAQVEKPAKGWTAFFVELTFPTGGVAPLKFTTEAFVTPDTLPARFVPPTPPPHRNR